MHRLCWKSVLLLVWLFPVFTAMMGPEAQAQDVIPPSGQAVTDLGGMLSPGEEQTLDLPIAGEVRFVAVLLSGAGVQRRIEVPLPDERISVVPPQLQLERTNLLGQARVQVHAHADEGLRDGWLALDGQKEIYVAWDGSREGLLHADLEDGDHSLTTKIKTLSGVAVIDTRRLTAD